MRPTTFVRAALAMTIAVLLGGTLLVAPATSAPARTSDARLAARATGCHVPHCWTAISFNTATGYSGWTVSLHNRGLSTKAAAMRSAYNKCRARPENTLHKGACVRPGTRNVYNQNGCVAVYFRQRHLQGRDRIVEWAKGTAYNPTPAKREARRAVNDGPGTIVFSRVSCTLRHL